MKTKNCILGDSNCDMLNTDKGSIAPQLRKLGHCMNYISYHN